MADEVIRRQGSATDHQSFTGAAGELTVENTNWNLRIHDGSTAGGFQTAMYADTLSAPGTSTDPGLALDTWRTPNADRATQVQIQTRSETNGTANGRVQVDVDESGGTTSDYKIEISYADKSLGDGGLDISSVSFTVPAGGSYRINNQSDPNASNQIETHREFTL